jgi:CheY-like chemotaxis protein
LDTKDFSQSAQGFTKSPLGIIALFIVLVYGFATLAVTFGNNLKDHIDPLIYFLVGFPVVVFFGFLWLVSTHSDKIYGPSDFKNEDNFMKMKMSVVASLAAATARPKQQEGGSSSESVQQLNSIVELVSKTNPKEKTVKSESWKNRILWVDDRPENNVYERKAFEAQGFNFGIALSTDEALEILNNSRFAAIISDMGRKEGLQEGYVLLEKIRKSGDKTPFFIYAGSNAPEHRRMALEKGAQGSTNNAQELFELVTSKLPNV